MLESYLTDFITFATLSSLAIASPGPDFAITLRNALKYGKYPGIVTALGIGTGILIHAGYTLLGFGLIMTQSVLVFTIFKVAGAAYLIYMGIKAIRTSPQNYQYEIRQQQQSQNILKKCFYNGFITNALNPKVTLTFLSLFTVIVKPNTPLLIQTTFAMWIALASTLWFSTLSICIANKRVKSVLNQIGHWIERGAGTFFILVGLRLLIAKLPQG